MIRNSIRNVDELEELLSRPTGGVIKTMKGLRGDIIVLGVSGKMGPTLARMAKRASDEAGVSRRVIGVSRFSNPESRKPLESHGIETIQCELLEPDQLDALPDAENVVYMAGMKFGSTGKEAQTWAVNTYLPGMVAQKYSSSKIVAFSTGNIYGLCPVVYGGSIETDKVAPDGDYAQSCLGRERIFEYFSSKLNIPMSIIRLNYAVELRYGVLVDIAERVFNEESIDLSMGAANMIWQGDANAVALMSFGDVSVPPLVLNVSGPEMLSIRNVSLEFGRIMGKEVAFTGAEAPDALITNAQLSHSLYGYPEITAKQVIEMVADWVMRGGQNLGKPTSFEIRDGKY